MRNKTKNLYPLHEFDIGAIHFDGLFIFVQFIIGRIIICVTNMIGAASNQRQNDFLLEDKLYLQQTLFHNYCLIDITLE